MHKGCAERIAGDRIGDVRAHPLWQREIGKADLLPPLNVRRGDVVDRAIREDAEIRWDLDEFA